MTKAKYLHVYLEIQNQEGVLNERIRQAMQRHNITMTFKGFQRMYVAWRQRQRNNPEKAIMQQQVAHAPGKLQQLESKLNGFSSILDELAPSESNPLDLPPSQEAHYKAFKLPINHNNILLLSDIHVPYHNIQALTLALKYGLENDVNTILLNGDIIDFYAIMNDNRDRI